MDPRYGELNAHTVIVNLSMIIQKWIHILLLIVNWLNAQVAIGIFIIKIMLNPLQKRKERIL
jgi:hypothetical protein